MMKEACLAGGLSVERVVVEESTAQHHLGKRPMLACFSLRNSKTPRDHTTSYNVDEVSILKDLGVFKNGDR